MSTIVQYRNRSIDLQPYFEGFPYFGFYCSDETDSLFYFKRSKRVHLYRTVLTAHPDLEGGDRLSDLDFSAFSAGSFDVDPSRNRLFFVGDECNDEVLNLYELDLTTGSRRKLTDETYLYGKKWLRDQNLVLLITRRKTAERMISSLKILDLESNTIRSVIEDTPEWPYSWSQILVHEPSGLVIWSVNARYDRNQSNFIGCDPRTRTTEILLPEGVKRSMLSVLTHWIDLDTFCFLSDESGYVNAYAYHVPSRKIRALTRWTAPIGSAQLFPSDGKPFLFAAREYPHGDTAAVVDPESGKTVYEVQTPSKMLFLRTDQKRLFAVTTSVMDPMTLWEWQPGGPGDGTGFVRSEFLRYPDMLLKKIVHGRAEAVEYPTFDIDENTGKTRMIHAFIEIPDMLPDLKEERRGVIVAFYGGENMFDTEHQILLDAGIIVMSPAVRGSWGFGADFFSLNDKDLGGNEIIDLIYAGRYLCERFDLKEFQVGLIGGSHGGYSAMRALTFPEEVNGRREFFLWGFAISSYGISNIIDYYHTCNIPDWVLQKAGDPEMERDKLMDRSPVSHADRATGPLLLIHGEKDNRVPADQSRQMAEAMARAGKPYTFVEIPGQGHGWKGLAENITYFKELFDFLDHSAFWMPWDHHSG